ncbi:IS110 family transposase [Microbacterium profundi]|uniref:IS110 family transposase n=1 Tax=Microbacterium profundi TaxID=450380 RepID=UPI0027DEC72E|nr:IS110 family transposase [Microbacterium profundi]MCE7481516.1 IS110 family transposase [Microbacterium profundi]
MELHGVGTGLAGQFAVTVGDNASRIHNEAAFAKLCGIATQPASRRTSEHHRLSRSGDRAANSALYIVAIVRMHRHEATRGYVQPLAATIAELQGSSNSEQSAVCTVPIVTAAETLWGCREPTARA